MACLRPNELASLLHIFVWKDAIEDTGNYGRLQAVLWLRTNQNRVLEMDSLVAEAFLTMMSNGESFGKDGVVALKLGRESNCLTYFDCTGKTESEVDAKEKVAHSHIRLIRDSILQGCKLEKFDWRANGHFAENARIDLGAIAHQMFITTDTAKRLKRDWNFCKLNCGVDFDNAELFE